MEWQPSNKRGTNLRKCIENNFNFAYSITNKANQLVLLIFENVYCSYSFWHSTHFRMYYSAERFDREIDTR